MYVHNLCLRMDPEKAGMEVKPPCHKTTMTWICRTENCQQLLPHCGVTWFIGSVVCFHEKTKAVNAEQHLIEAAKPSAPCVGAMEIIVGDCTQTCARHQIRQPQHTHRGRWLALAWGNCLAMGAVDTSLLTLAHVTHSATEAAMRARHCKTRCSKACSKGLAAEVVGFLAASHPPA